MTQKYVPKKYVAGTPDAEVLGISLQGFINCVDYDTRIEKLLQRYGLVNISPDDWYPQQKMLDVLKEIANLQVAHVGNLVGYGMRIEQLADYPPEIDTIDKGLAIMNTVHQEVYNRNLPPKEGFPIQKISDRHSIVTNYTPMPNEMVYGIISSLVRRLCPRDQLFIVRPLEIDEHDIQSFEIKWGSDPDAIR